MSGSMIPSDSPSKLNGPVTIHCHATIPTIIFIAIIDGNYIEVQSYEFDYC